MKKITILIFLLGTFVLKAQDDYRRVIITAVPFLSIAGDARAAALGDMGVATSPDVYSMQWNPSKTVFNEKDKEVAFSYNPYLENIVTDIALLNLSFYNKINERSAFGLGMRYFTLGEIELRQYASDPGTLAKPNEIAIDGSYSLKLSPNFSMGVSGRFIRSNLKIPQTTSVDTRAASTFAVDLSGYYQGEFVDRDTYDGRWRWGFNLSNLGPKVTYDITGERFFIPTNLRLGMGYDYRYDENSLLSLTFETTKLLVPTPKDYNGNGQLDALDFEVYQDIPYFEGALNSFSDAPGGFSEELKEITWAVSAEYLYAQRFSMRMGYFSENLEKGSKRFLSIGTGFVLDKFTLDLSYLISNAPVLNPLQNAIRFSVRFNLI